MSTGWFVLMLFIVAFIVNGIIYYNNYMEHYEEEKAKHKGNQEIAFEKVEGIRINKTQE